MVQPAAGENAAVHFRSESKDFQQGGADWNSLSWMTFQKTEMLGGKKRKNLEQNGMTWNGMGSVKMEC